MIDILKNIEKNEILGILSNADNFRSLDIDYQPPRVKRIWTQLGKYRLSFHYLEPCNASDPLYHPHPWPSVIHQLVGEYETGITYSNKLEYQFENNTGKHNAALKEIEAARFIVNGDMYYEMMNKNGFHYVQPITLCKSVMLMDQPFQTVKNPPTKKLKELSFEEVEEMRLWFYDYYASKF